MKTAVVTLRRCLLDSQDYGSDDEHMVSRVWFDITAGNIEELDQFVDIKQTVGSDFETSPLEVGRPRGLAARLEYGALRAEVEAYYRGLVGTSGSAFHFEGARNVRMRDCSLDLWKRVEIALGDTSGGW